MSKIPNKIIDIIFFLEMLKKDPRTKPEAFEYIDKLIRVYETALNAGYK